MSNLTQLYNKNTLDFGYEEAGITFVKEHRVSYRTIQVLGGIMTDIKIDANGNSDMHTMVEILMGKPNQTIKSKIIKGLGSHYDSVQVQRDLKRKLEDEGEIETDEEIRNAVIVLMNHFEDAICASLFNAYLEKQNADAAESTPR